MSHSVFRISVQWRNNRQEIEIIIVPITMSPYINPCHNIIIMNLKCTKHTVRFRCVYRPHMLRRHNNITVLVLTASSFILTIFKLAAQPGPVSAAVKYRCEKFVYTVVDFPGPIS